MAFGLEISCVKNGHQTWNTMKCGWTMADLHGKVQVTEIENYTKQEKSRSHLAAQFIWLMSDFATLKPKLDIEDKIQQLKV